MKRKRKNGEQAFDGWMYDKAYDKTRKEIAETVQAFYREKYPTQFIGCFAIWITVWAFCFATPAMLFGINGLTSCSGFIIVYFVMCAWIIKRWLNDKRQEYYDDMDVTDNIQDNETVI